MKLLIAFALAVSPPPTVEYYSLVIPHAELVRRLRIEEQYYYLFAGSPEMRAYFAGRAAVYREQLHLLAMSVPKDK